mmetsp:Transcript_93748/g.264692  ORF Transcript_93748/g.264692 Transcript_93748/m.264692 type:complete len:338 (-) Transcript_93748:498-1511(-)
MHSSRTKAVRHAHCADAPHGSHGLASWYSHANSSWARLHRELVHGIDECGDELGALRPVEALTQVRDEGRSVRPDRLQHAADLLADSLHRASRRRAQMLRVEVALQCCDAATARFLRFIPESLGRLPEVRRAVSCDHVVPSGLKVRQGIGRSTREDHQRHRRVSLLQDARNLCHGGKREFAEVVGRNVLPHGLEDLQNLAACAYLGRKVFDNYTRQQAHELLRSRAVFREPALTSIGSPPRRATHHVKKERPRRRTKTDERPRPKALRIHLLSYQTHGVEDVRKFGLHESGRVRGSGRRETLHIFGILEGLWHQDAFAPRHFHAHTERLGNDEDVRE